MDFYDRVKKAVKPTGKSLQEVIINAGINYDTYYARKRMGNLPWADEAVKIACALGTTVEYLVTGNRSAIEKNLIDDMQKVLDKYKLPK